MGANTSIEWATHTFNPWIGCTKVSAGCANCYAEADQDKRRGRVKWGKGNPRSRTSASYWQQPIKWNREAAATNARPRVFCASGRHIRRRSPSRVAVQLAHADLAYTKPRLAVADETP